MVYMVNKTIWGEPVGKFQLGTTYDDGLEAALGPKYIGVEPAVSLGMLDIRIPERGRLGVVPQSQGAFLLGFITALLAAKTLGKTRISF